jgi:hypothetical protein
MAVLMVAALVGLFTGMAPAHAAQPGTTEISSDPFAGTASPVAEHSTEVEPDSFAWGSTVVTAFQTGRVFNGGSSDIGWATSQNGGVSWTHGFLPGTTAASTPAGPYYAVSDASVAYDAKDKAWVVSYLGLHAPGGGTVDVIVSRSTDGGLTWGDPITVAAGSTFYDKNWSVCDNTPSSRYYGNCYTEFDNAGSRDLELMSTSRDGGLTWSAPAHTADSVHGLGGQPVVKPDGRVVVPFEACCGSSGIRSFSSDDGGATWNASVLISAHSDHEAPGIRTEPLPSAEISKDGTVYVVWQDNRFEPGGNANDIVLTSSADGTTWSPVSRIPLDPVGAGVDHLTAGVAVDPSSQGDNTALALTYYAEKPSGCSGSSCELTVEFSSSLDNGRTWSSPVPVSDPMQLGWLAPTSQGVMFGDYVSTAFLTGQQRVVASFCAGLPPASDGTLNEPAFAALEKVRTGDIASAKDPVLFTGDMTASQGTVPTAD